jgi:hypothetical protein
MGAYSRKKVLLRVCLRRGSGLESKGYWIWPKYVIWIYENVTMKLICLYNYYALTKTFFKVCCTYIMTSVSFFVFVFLSGAYQSFLAFHWGLGSFFSVHSVIDSVMAQWLWKKEALNFFICDSLILPYLHFIRSLLVHAHSTCMFFLLFLLPILKYGYCFASHL